jgi:threonine synthase
VVPIASGSLFTKLGRGFAEWLEIGLVEGSQPIFNGAQADGCSPVATAFAEGSKTLGYEVAEQLGWRLPEQIVVPVASGSQLTKVDKGFTEFGKLGLVEATPYKVFGAQATGCSPVAQAFAEGHDVIRPVRPDTIARSLAIGNPADGPYVLDAVRRTGGALADVSDAEVVEGIRLLAATEGVFAETAGGVTVATTRSLKECVGLPVSSFTHRLRRPNAFASLSALINLVSPGSVFGWSVTVVGTGSKARYRQIDLGPASMSSRVIAGKS